MAKGAQRLRIIGGQHRGRVLNFTPAKGLRPTPDRVRETLFNWLQPVIDGAYCLDLFAGSGALGLEAASRGAVNVIMLEPNAQSARQIRTHIETLKSDNICVIEQKAEAYIKQGRQRFDIVFIDPPYHSGLLQSVCQLMEEHDRLKPGSRIYLESEAALEDGNLPDNWTLTQRKRAGQVFYHLATRG